MASASLPQPPLSFSDDSDTDGSSCSGNEAASKSAHTASLEDSIFRAYLQTLGSSSQADLSKIRAFLLSSRAGALSCLICLERIRTSDPVWSCSPGCHAVFHLFCIQSWARQASALDAERAAARLSRDYFPSAAVSSNWHCPKCRAVYSASAIPRSYRCFCGKLEDPPPDPWILPHTCGEVCGRPLRGNCGHECLLLCHPGPCPPCPKLVQSRCFCGSVQDMRRCASKVFSCNGSCSKLLSCGVHRCSERCHDGPCPPCREKAVHRCQCGKLEEERECCERVFQCESRCGGRLRCGKHDCERGCHSGPCGDCPLQGKRTCPCGKKEHVGLACDVPARTCGSTCEKMLSCGLHQCPERCHRGRCAETCRTVVVKSCRCGGLKKEFVKENVNGYGIVDVMPVNVAVAMGTAPLAQRCDVRWKHLVEVQLNSLLVPFLLQSPGDTLDRRCNVLFQCIVDLAHQEVFLVGLKHNENHQDAPDPVVYLHCADMGQVASHTGVIMGHAHPVFWFVKKNSVAITNVNRGSNLRFLLIRCHGPKPAPNPEFTLRPKKTKSYLVKCSPGSPCPPCKELVLRSCVGQHIGAERLFCAIRRESLHVLILAHCLAILEAVRLAMVTVRCTCQNLKKEWLCQNIQAAHCNAGRNPGDISKSQFGLGLLACNSDCANKLKAVDSELQFRKPNVAEVFSKKVPWKYTILEMKYMMQYAIQNLIPPQSKPSDVGHGPKRKKRRERMQNESSQISRLQMKHPSNLVHAGHAVVNHTCRWPSCEIWLPHVAWRHAHKLLKGCSIENREKQMQASQSAARAEQSDFGLAKAYN
ncbi:hypothetical protein ACLOJK_031703 [Asimina triloba]